MRRLLAFKMADRFNQVRLFGLQFRAQAFEAANRFSKCGLLPFETTHRLDQR